MLLNSTVHMSASIPAPAEVFMFVGQGVVHLRAGRRRTQPRKPMSADSNRLNSNVAHKHGARIILHVRLRVQPVHPLR